ncbi:MAG: MopE-related protein, partial [Planctomycetota bacterium]
VCTVGTGICQDSGLMVCTGDGTGTECSAVAGSPVTEQCDGLDNDCDGSTDENFPSLGDVCTVGTGICQDSGLMVCTGDGTGTECSAVAGSPAVEQCDGLDNDCDGSTDEGGPWDDKGAACIVGTGICEAYGTKICDSESPSGPTVCSAIAGTPTPEVCNWLDDDCDGSTDEGGMWTDKGDVCSVGTGICQAYGIKVCDLGSPSGPTVCSAIAGTPTPEVCNWLDDDCDGSTDEGGLWADKGSVCSVGVGICEAYGTKICDSGSPSGPTVCSATPGTPTTEICDNYLDDDCDGLTDLDDPDCPS